MQQGELLSQPALKASKVRNKGCNTPELSSEFLSFVSCVAGRQLPVQTLRCRNGQRDGVQPVARESLLPQGLQVPPHGDSGEQYILSTGSLALDKLQYVSWYPQEFLCAIFDGSS